MFATKEVGTIVFKHQATSFMLGWCHKNVNIAHRCQNVARAGEVSEKPVGVREIKLLERKVSAWLPRVETQL